MFHKIFRVWVLFCVFCPLLMEIVRICTTVPLRITHATHIEHIPKLLFLAALLLHSIIRLARFITPTLFFTTTLISRSILASTGFSLHVASFLSPVCLSDHSLLVSVFCVVMLPLRSLSFSIPSYLIRSTNSWSLYYTMHIEGQHTPYDTLFPSVRFASYDKRIDS